MSPVAVASTSVRRGFSLPELLLVVSILALCVLFTVPFVTTKMRETRLRSAAGQFAVTLRAARMVAVTAGTRTPVTVRAYDAGNSYEYTDSTGKLRQVQLSGGVAIVSSDSPIVFMPNGSVDAAEPPVTRFKALHVPEEWTVQTSLGGVPFVSHTSESEPVTSP